MYTANQGVLLFTQLSASICMIKLTKVREHNFEAIEQRKLLLLAMIQRHRPSHVLITSFEILSLLALKTYFVVRSHILIVI